MDVDVSLSDVPFKPQKELKYNHLLPYSADLVPEAVEYLALIKGNLSRSLILSDARVHWLYELSKYIKLYGRFFPKEDHLFFIHLLYDVIQLENVELSKIMSFASVLTTLLKKRELLTREELQLDWKPLYQLYERTLYASKVYFVPDGFESTLKSLIRACRVYFVIESTQDILDEFRPYLCPFDPGMAKGLNYLELFLPTVVTRDDEISCGFQLWLDELLSIWDSNPNSPSWEQNLLWLLSRLAHDNIGLIDWSPWIPKIFTHLIKSFGLQGGALKVQVKRNYTVFDVNAVVLWIVSMFGGPDDEVVIQHVESLFKSLESFYHPSNLGTWNVKLSQLLSKLPATLIRRLHRERYKKMRWERQVPVGYHMTDRTITRFVTALTPVINLAIFSRHGSMDAAQALQHLSAIRPEIVVPPLLDKLYTSLQTVIEPHRLTATLQCAVSVARALVSGGASGPSIHSKDGPSIHFEDGPSIQFKDGPSHVIPLLMASLPGIDSNDVKKSMVTFQFISTLCSLIPIVDCSSAVYGGGTYEVGGGVNESGKRRPLTEEEKSLCAQTAQFEDFLLQFMDRCFALIENSSYEHRPERHDNEGIRLTAEEGITEIGLTSTFGSILAQASRALTRVAIKRLYGFVCNRIFETKVSGKIVSSMVGKAARTAPEDTCACFIPHFTTLIITLTGAEDVVNEEKVDDELLFAMQGLSEIVKCDGVVLMRYQSELVTVMDRILYINSRKGYLFTHALYGNIIRQLTSIYLTDLHCTDIDFEVTGQSSDSQETMDMDGSAPIDWSSNNLLPIHVWGRPGDINNLNAKFHVPNEEELNFARFLIERFALERIDHLVKWVESASADQIDSNGQSTDGALDKEEVRKSLGVILEAVSGAATCLPIWEGEELRLDDYIVESSVWRVKSIGLPPINYSDGRNIRLDFVTKLRRVLHHMSRRCEDDTKSLNLIIKLYHTLMFNFGMSKSEFDIRWKSFHVVKKTLENKLVGEKKHIRPLIMDRVMLQHEMRVRNKVMTKLTSVHGDLISDLISLSVSHYSEVRQKAQETLSSAFGRHPYVYRLAIDPILKIISKDGDANHESFKGSLHLLLGRKTRSILLVNDWGTIHKVWLGLINAQHSEKPSIIRLLRSMSDTVLRYFETLPLVVKIPDGVRNAAMKAWSLGHKPSIRAPSADELASADRERQKRNDENLSHYHGVIEGLVTSIENHQLHWRYVDLAYELLTVLIRHDVAFPVIGVSLMVRNLISDHLITRKYCIANVGAILFDQKRPHVKKLIEPPDRKSNKWLQYDKSVDYTKEEVWKETQFVFKPYIGYYCYPQDGVRVVDYEKEPRVDRGRDELREEEIPIYDFFMDQGNVDKLLSYLSLEEKKGSDKFSTKRYTMFKRLFMNFGPVFLPILEPGVARLVSSPLESHQRAGAEVIAGVMRGSRHWPYDAHVTLRTFVEPLLRSAMDSVIQETVSDWGTCCATCFEREDGRRVSWFIDIVCEDPLRGTRMLEQAMEVDEDKESKMESDPNTDANFLAPKSISTLMQSLTTEEGALIKSALASGSMDQIKDAISNTLTRNPHILTKTPVSSVGDGVSSVGDPVSSVAGDGVSSVGDGKRSEGLSQNGKGPSKSQNVTSFIQASRMYCLLGVVQQEEWRDLSLLNYLVNYLRSDQHLTHSLQSVRERIGVLLTHIFMYDVDGPCLPGTLDKAPKRDDFVNYILPLLDPLMKEGESDDADSAHSSAGSSVTPSLTSPEKKAAGNLLKTVSKWILQNYSKNSCSASTGHFKLLPVLCHVQSEIADEELMTESLFALVILSHTLLTTSGINAALEACENILDSKSWRARNGIGTFLQYMVSSNLFTIMASREWVERVTKQVLRLLEDERVEVREGGAGTFGGLIHCELIKVDDEMIRMLIKKANTELRRVEGRSVSVVEPRDLVSRHAGILGLCSLINAHPYDVPLFLPKVIMELTNHMNDPAPIPATIKKTMNTFKRTHLDNWNVHKENFTEDELSELTNLLVSPSYYA